MSNFHNVRMTNFRVRSDKKSFIVSGLINWSFDELHDCTIDKTHTTFIKLKQKKELEFASIFCIESDGTFSPVKTFFIHNPGKKWLDKDFALLFMENFDESHIKNRVGEKLQIGKGEIAKIKDEIKKEEDILRRFKDSLNDNKSPEMKKYVSGKISEKESHIQMLK